MAQELDLRLPSTAPAEYLANDAGGILPTALYTLVAISNDELRQVARACETDSGLDEGQVVRLAPQPHFESEPLRAVYESHLQLGLLGEFEAVYFAVVIDRNWRGNGVLLVTLANDDEPPAIDSYISKAEAVGLTVQNLQIANSDWTECRELAEFFADEQEIETEIETIVESPSDADAGQSEDEGPEYPSRKPSCDYLIPIYLLDSLDADAIIRDLEEDFDRKPNPFTDYRIRNQASLTPATHDENQKNTLKKPDSLISQDLINQACTLHPVRCRANKWLNKTYLLICDNTEPTREGLLIVNVTWDGVTKGRSKSQLREIGTRATRTVKRISGTPTWGIKYGYDMIAENLSVWESTHPSFGFFQINTNMPAHGATVVDSEHWDRELGDEFFVTASTPVELYRATGLESIDVEWTLKGAVDRFPWFCFDCRFLPFFSRQYFLFLDHDHVTEKGVTLVRYDWDQNLDRSEEELWDLRQLYVVRTMRVPADQAFPKILEAAANGSDDWQWEAYL